MSNKVATSTGAANGTTAAPLKSSTEPRITSMTNGAALSERMVWLSKKEIKVDWAINIRNGGQAIAKDDPEIVALVDSIREIGLLENLVVWEKITPPPKSAPEGTVGSVEYILAAGFKRSVAIDLLGHEKAHCRLVRGELRDILLMNGAENLQRDDLAIFDVAARCSTLKKNFNVTGAEIGRSWKLEKATINNYIRVYDSLHPKILAHWKKLDENFDDMRRLAALPQEEQLTAYKALRELREGNDQDGSDDEESNDKPLKLPPMLRRAEVEGHVQYHLAKMEEIKVGREWIAVTEEHIAGARAYAYWVLNRKKTTFRTQAVEEE